MRVMSVPAALEVRELKRRRSRGRGVPPARRSFILRGRAYGTVDAGIGSLYRP